MTTRDRPFPPGGPVYVFTGAMDYPPNVDAVRWFADNVLPLLPGARFVIVGASPAASVRALADRPGITVTGRVPDVRPYLLHADAAVAPMRIARGIQNKVLEAMASARPVVATSDALEGIAAVPGTEVLAAAGDRVDRRQFHPHRRWQRLRLRARVRTPGARLGPAGRRLPRPLHLRPDRQHPPRAAGCEGTRARHLRLDRQQRGDARHLRP